MSSRMVVVSRLSVVVKGYDKLSVDGWESPTEIDSFGIEDDDLAKASAYGEAKRRLASLIEEAKAGKCDDRPWLEQIIVCPSVEGLGKGGSEQIQIENKILCITVGIE